MRKISKFFLVFAVLALIAVLIPQVVLADPPAPTSVTLVNYYATNNLLETGDFFLLIDYNIAYSGGYPTVPASNAFTFRLFDPTGSTEIADALPYVFTTATTGFTGTNGFGEGVVAYYFNSASAPTWDLNYIIKVSGNPAEFSSPLEYDFQLPSAAYQSSSDNATGLANELRTIATQLSIQWGIPLLSDASATSVFTADGEGYFRNAIPGVQSLAPNIFEDQQEQSPDTTSASYDTNLSNTYQHRFDNSWVHTSLAAGADLFHLPLPLFVGIFALAGCIWMIKKSNDRFQSPVFGYFGSIIVIMGFSLLFLGLTLLALVLFVGGFLVSNALFFRKA
jgi:hypothetical protein